MKLKNFVIVQSVDDDERPIIEEIRSGELTKDSIINALELCYSDKKCYSDKNYPIGLQDEIIIITGNAQKVFKVEDLLFKALQIELNM